MARRLPRLSEPYFCKYVEIMLRWGGTPEIYKAKYIKIRDQEAWLVVTWTKSKIYKKWGSRGMGRVQERLTLAKNTCVLG